jgi:hypothetical protein
VSGGPADFGPEPSADLIDRCGDAVLAASRALAQEGGSTSAAVAAFHALASSAEGALTLVEALLGSLDVLERPLDLEIAAEDYLRQAELLVAKLRSAYDALDLGPPDR